MLRVLGILLAIVLIGAYTYTHTRNAFLGPHVQLNEPQHSETVSESLIEIEGTAERASTIAINDKQALLEENGSFSASLLLAPGYNIIEITAVDRFGRESTDHLEIMYLENQEVQRL